MWVLIFFLVTLPLWWMLTLKIYSFVKKYWLEILIFLGKTFWFLLKVGLVCLIIGAITLLIIKLTENKKDNHYQSNYEYTTQLLPPPPELDPTVARVVLCSMAKTNEDKKYIGCK
jgi:hypothetical protein